MVLGSSPCRPVCLEGGWRGSWSPGGSWGSPLSLHVSPEHGFVGYSEELMFNNTLPDYSQGESFFTVFGVFFPAATGTVRFYPRHVFLHRNIMEMSRSKGISSGLWGEESRTVLGHSRPKWSIQRFSLPSSNSNFVHSWLIHLNLLFCLCGQKWLVNSMGWCGGVNPSLPRTRLRHWSRPMLSGQKVSSLFKRADCGLSYQMSLMTWLHWESGKSMGGRSLHLTSAGGWAGLMPLPRMDPPLAVWCHRFILECQQSSYLWA